MGRVGFNIKHVHTHMYEIMLLSIGHVAKHFYCVLPLNIVMTVNKRLQSHNYVQVLIW